MTSLRASLSWTHTLLLVSVLVSDACAATGTACDETKHAADFVYDTEDRGCPTDLDTAACACMCRAETEVHYVESCSVEENDASSFEGNCTGFVACK